MRKLFVLFLFCLSLMPVSGEDIVVISKDDIWVSLQLNGKDESCFISVSKYKRHGSRISASYCKFLTNSKNIDIICTEKKTICKTEQEILTFADNAKFTVHDNKKTRKKVSQNNCGLSFMQVADIREECKIAIRFGRTDNFSKCYSEKERAILQKQGCHE